MKIKYLPTEFKHLAVNNALMFRGLYGNHTTSDIMKMLNLDLSEAFPWRKSMNGYEFWADLNKCDEFIKHINYNNIQF
jgi:cytoplasmic iron level regulating protein YaaA (DUF328/UPF0246 family)